MSFIGFYASSTTSNTGCVKRFVTTEREDLLFPAQVEHLCDLCGSTHNFRLDRVATMATPRQRKSIRAYVTAQAIDLDVQIGAKTA